MATSAQEQVCKLQEALASLPPGAKRVKVDGLEAELSIQDAIAQLNYWEKKASQEAGNRPKISRVRLDAE